MNPSTIAQRTPTPRTTLWRLGSAVGLLAVLATGCASPSRNTHSGWQAHWSVVATDCGDFQGPWVQGSTETLTNHPFVPMHGALCLHPLSTNSPAVLRYAGSFDPKHSLLNISAAAHAEGDTEVVVGLTPLMQGDVEFLPLARYTLYAGASRHLTVDLAEFAETEPGSKLADLINSKMFAVDIQVHSGGQEAWHFEHAYIDRIWWSR